MNPDLKWIDSRARRRSENEFTEWMVGDPCQMFAFLLNSKHLGMNNAIHPVATHLKYFFEFES